MSTSDRDNVRRTEPRAASRGAASAADPASARARGDDTGYVHGFTEGERERLARQARFLEFRVHDRLPYRRARQLVEIGCGVGAQTEILLRHFPELHVTGIDRSAENLAAARVRLTRCPWAAGRFAFELMDAGRLEFAAERFDAAFLCWILEHVADPALVLAEARRVLRPGAPIVVTEVQNASFFLEPYSPNTLAYWMAFNDHQLELGGDPFVGAKLGNLLQAVGFQGVETEVKPIHLDNRHRGERAEFLAYWTELLLSGAEGLLAARKVSTETVEGMKRELAGVARNPNAVFFYAFVQARAHAG